ncbi:MAG TPA: MFS transporter, partial [Dehalococcoidia bacterium]|nr:MFS transporter [Dehalococcoidia bacterium]
RSRLTQAESLTQSMVIRPISEIDLTDPPIQQPRKTIRRTPKAFEALHNHSFRWFYLAMFGHFIPMNIQMVIRPWLAYSLTGSYGWAGWVTLAGAIPMLGLSPIGGLIADRLPRQRLIQIGQFINGANALYIAIMFVLGRMGIGHLMVAAVIQGTVMPLMMPARQAMISQILGDENLTSGVALSGAGMAITRAVAPPLMALGLFLIPGDLIDGSKYIYFIMAFCYFAAVLALVPVRGYAPYASNSRLTISRGFQDIVDGFRYAKENVAVRSILIANFFIVIFVMPFHTLLAPFLENELQADELTIGLLYGLTGVGTIVGSLLIGNMQSKNRGKVLILSAAFLSVIIAVLAISNSILLTSVVLLLSGLPQAARQTLSNVLVQTYSSSEYRGRVSSLYMMEFGFTMFGVFLFAQIADIIGIRAGLFSTAIALFIVSVVLIRARVAKLD